MGWVVAMIQMLDWLSCGNANYSFFFHVVLVSRTRINMWDSWVQTFILYKESHSAC